MNYIFSYCGVSCKTKYTNFVLLKCCMKMLCSFVQDKRVSWQYCGEITVRHCVGGTGANWLRRKKTQFEV